jgi:hypothetical protein
MMNRMIRFDAGNMTMSPRWLLAVAACCVVAGPLVADVAPGRRVLFDGKSLDGWKKADFVRSGTVTVEDGTLVMNAGGYMTGVTTTLRDLPTTDYELSYEAMKLAGRDFFAAATFPVGKSFATLVNGGWGGNVTGISSLDGSDASENETTAFVKYEDKTWYRFRVQVTDDGIRCWVDDKKIIEVGIQDRQVGTRVETDANKPLGFATYETSGALRSIEIRKLAPAEVAEIKQATRQ